MEHLQASLLTASLPSALYGIEICFILVHFIRWFFPQLFLGSECGKTNVHDFFSFTSLIFNNSRSFQVVVSDVKDRKSYWLPPEKDTTAGT